MDLQMLLKIILLWICIGKQFNYKLYTESVVLIYNRIQQKTEMSIEQKHQLIDDQAVFQYDELQGLTQKNIQALKKSYHVLSIIGSQSSGKSTLLNSLFRTTFEQLNRKARVGQTTKGIWYAVDPKSSMMILDVEGSDSNQRQQRTKVQRRNSLFALAVSHTLLINLWIQQIGLYKGSQLSILEIILQLNLRLFGSQQPKNIIFVVRDYVKGTQNLQALKQKLFGKIQQAWHNIKKPQGKQHVQLTDLFKLQAYFLPSKLEERQMFEQQVGKLRNHLFEIAANQKVINKNVSMSDVPQYMKNLWTTITEDKDVNLPQQKILLSNMKCHEIKKQIYSTFEDQFRDELQKSQRKMNIQFAVNITAIVKKMMDKYDEETLNYHAEEATKVKQQFLVELQRKIQLSYSYQVKHIVNQVLREFTDEVNKSFLKDKGIQNIKNIKPQTQKKFAQLIQKVSYKPQWAEGQIKKFEKTLQQAFESQKQRIVIDSLKDFDRSIKKQIQNIVSNAFYDKKIFTQNFWGHLNASFKQVEHKAKNSIVSLYKKLEFKPDEKPSSINKSINEHVEKARSNATEQLKTIIKMKTNDLLFYIMRHFFVDFNLDVEGIPRQWPNMKPQQITALYQKTKQKYLDMIAEFAEYGLNLDGDMVEATSKQITQARSTLGAVGSNSGQNKQLMKSSDMIALRKKLEQSMNGDYQQALKKNKQVYMGAIPKWGWILFLIVAFDDILLWLSSPALAIPITIILIAIGGVFFFGGPTLASSLVNNARSAARNSFGNLAAQATTKIMTAQRKSV